ncbi:hypothetical protein TPAR_02157 [Tolypocladium paradoxum]|uniref:Alpha N-terminal protein methyltransferase 1 n=1 Tax=Tolypocladium paradoxum TaxID=94208 RepID=A0A2S4L5C7_9HYPO|nr:hypothetical protein TPAR_02157 [Tolypocladium paradoxum]
MTAPAADSYISARAGRAYWQGVEADVNGMLGGMPAVSKMDLQGSRAFLAKLGVGRGRAGLRPLTRALEGGAGIGRVTEGLLLSIAETVDVVEPIAKFTDALAGKHGVGRVYNIGLEEWDASVGQGVGDAGGGGGGGDEDVSRVRYDLFWNQWCLGHLTDDQLVRYLQRCTARMSDEKSLIVVKENMSTSGRDAYDEVDSSVTRQDEKFRQIFEQAGLRIVRTELQRAMPKELFPVRMYALRRRQ